MKILKSIFTILFTVFVAGAILLALNAQSFFYYPQIGASSFTPKSAGLVYEDLLFLSSDNKTKLNGWFIHSINGSKNAKATILQVHGNAGKLENHLSYVSWLARENYNVFMFDYRGYGLSDNKKQTPKGLMQDT
ncbi:MAG: serine aminopeptidase domain-containing protein, partial [Campylobacteraceae bacterium]